MTDVKLITVVPTGASNGYPVNTEYQLQILAEKVSVKRVEFYESLKAGIQPAFIYKVYPQDFVDANKTVAGVTYEPTYLEAGGIRYKITRTYETSPDTMELTCAKVI